ncbi:hypothetical protein [Flavobacterium mesophilum]|uniref:hypothetical protein n=1 Tax=Flavobacterium mesophilum TaxID=3143495 RepID=UPI0031D0B05C
MFTKPNSKNIASVAVTGGAFVIGAKLGDGIAAVVPDSMASYKRYILAAVGLLGAACVDGKTTMGQASQSALIGLGAKQLYDELSDALADAVPVKEASTTTNKFVNAIVSTQRPALVPTGAAETGVAAPWLGSPSDLWDRDSFQEEQPAKLAQFTGV